jgi:hypothetical protein
MNHFGGPRSMRGQQFDLSLGLAQKLCLLSRVCRFVGGFGFDRVVPVAMEVVSVQAAGLERFISRSVILMPRG